jgi:hypothetical protein
MNTKWLVSAAIAAAMAIPAFAWAHEGENHTVMGTISSISGTNLMVKVADGKTVMVMMDAKTKITKGATKLEVGALKVGDRVVAAGLEEKEMIMAATVKVGAAAPVKPAAKPVAKK